MGSECKWAPRGDTTILKLNYGENNSKFSFKFFELYISNASIYGM
jgi:hypothetical protein